MSTTPISMPYKATRQQIFDVVATHLLNQGKRSSFMSTCLYRGPNGMMCAVGVLIPDEVYDPAMESKKLGGIIDMFPNLPKVLKKQKSLLSDLQGVHDSYAPEYWENRLLQLASEKKLNTDCITSRENRKK